MEFLNQPFGTQAASCAHLYCFRLSSWQRRHRGQLRAASCRPRPPGVGWVARPIPTWRSNLERQLKLFWRTASFPAQRRTQQFLFHQLRSSRESNSFSTDYNSSCRLQGTMLMERTKIVKKPCFASTSLDSFKAKACGFAKLKCQTPKQSSPIVLRKD